MPDVRLRVNGRDYGGWKAVRITRGIESIAGSFELACSDRWAGQDTPWPIAHGARCELLIKLDGVGAPFPVITGYVDRRGLSYGSEDHAFSVTGRDRTGDLVDCSAFIGAWQFNRISILRFAQLLAEPFGVKVTMQAGLAPPALPANVTIDPGDTAFDALERACRMVGVLPISDGTGGLVLTRAGSTRCTTALVQGQNILTASAEFDVTGRYRRYIVMGQHPGNDEYAGDQTASVRGQAKDPNVVREARVLVIRAESAMTPAQAKVRAEWEAKVRAARGDAVTVKVQGWTQGDGTLWPVNARVKISSPYIGVDGEMLITQATYGLDEHAGTTTELALKRPDAFLPEPVVPPGRYAELVHGVKVPQKTP